MDNVTLNILRIPTLNNELLGISFLPAVEVGKVVVAADMLEVVVADKAVAGKVAAEGNHSAQGWFYSFFNLNFLKGVQVSLDKGYRYKQKLNRVIYV